MKNPAFAIAAFAVLALAIGFGAGCGATAHPQSAAQAPAANSAAAQPSGMMGGAMMGGGTMGSAESSGITGRVVGAWGNMPAQAPTTQCVTILDETGQKTVATGTCSGAFQQFRVPLKPGTYTVRVGHGNTRKVVVPQGQWITLNPTGPVGHVP